MTGEERTEAATAPRCCKCCDVPDEPDRCLFNGQRDSHSGPCEDCEPDAYAAHLAAQPPWRFSDVPF